MFAWNFKGELIYAAINYPGSWHDSRLAAASGIYTLLLEHYAPSGYAVLADNAFPRGGDFLEGKILRARKSNEMVSNSNVLSSTCLAAVNTLLERALPSERQSAGWGVRALKGSLARLKTVLPADSHARY